MEFLIYILACEIAGNRLLRYHCRKGLITNVFLYQLQEC